MTDPPGFGPPPAQYPHEFDSGPLAAPRTRSFPVKWVLFAVVAVLVVAFLSLSTLFRTFGGSPTIVGSADGPVVVTPEQLDLPVLASPGPVPKPVRYSGSGAKDLAIRKPERGTALLYVKGNASGERFFVTPLDTDRVRRGVLVGTFAPYEGVRLLDHNVPYETALLRIEATGPWTVEVRSVRSVQAFTAKASGRADAVLRYTGRAGVATIAGGKRGGAFSVHVYDARGSGRVVTLALEPIREREHFPAGPALVEVRADAPWSISVTPAAG